MSLFTDPSIARQYLIVFDAWDPVGAQTVKLYAGTHAFATEPTDTPANIYFEPIVISAFRRRSSIYRPRRIGGASIPTTGAILMELPPHLAAWKDYNFEGQPFVCYMGQVGVTSWATHQIVAEGICATRTGGRQRLDIPTRDRGILFDVDVSPNKFAGTGQAEGGSDLTAKNKPKCLGDTPNITPILVDRTNQVFMVNDGQINAITACMDRGIALTNAGDVADLWATSVSSGQFKTDLANGLIRVGGAIADLSRDITCDVEGDKTGGTYRSTVADLMKWIADSVVALPSAKVNAATFTALNTTNSATVGLWLPQGGNAFAVMNRLADSIGAFWTFDRQDVLCVGRFEAPAASPDFTLVEGDFVEHSLKIIGTDPAIWQQTVRYARNWTVQTDQDLAGGTTYHDRDWLAQPLRDSVDDDATIKTDFPEAGPDTIETLLTATSAADAYATFRLNLYGQRRDRWQGTVKTIAFERVLAEEGSITNSHNNLSAKALRLVTLDESFRRNEAVMELWG